ncbi:MAG: hypothetical protein U1F27_11520 [Turneriella sp.]
MRTKNRGLAVAVAGVGELPVFVDSPAAPVVGAWFAQATTQITIMLEQGSGLACPGASSGLDIAYDQGPQELPDFTACCAGRRAQDFSECPNRECGGTERKPGKN